MEKVVNPKVSILVPVYGVERFIQRCAHSLFNQTYGNIEYIFIDDKTPDRSIELLKNVVAEFPNRKDFVRTIKRDANRGLAAARTTGISHATGDFLMHVDSDDYIELETVELAVNAMVNNNADIVSFGCFREYANKTIIQIPPSFKDGKDMCLKFLRKKNINVGVWGRMYRRSLYVNNNIKTLEGFNMAEDFQVTPRLAYYASKVAVIKKPLYHYDLTNENALTFSFDSKKCNQCWKAVEINEAFFKGKGNIYTEMLEKGKVVILSRDILKCSLDKKNDRYLDEVLRERQKQIDKSNYKAVPFMFRVPLYVKSKTLVRLYYKIALKLKKYL